MHPPETTQKRFTWALVWTVIGPALLLISLASMLLWRVHSLREDFERVNHSDQVIARVHFLQELLLDRETGVRAYLLVKEADFLEPYHRANAQLGPAFDELRSQISDNPAQSQRL